MQNKIMISDFALGLHNGGISEDDVIKNMQSLNDYMHFVVIVPRKYTSHISRKFTITDSWSGNGVMSKLQYGDANSRNAYAIYCMNDTVIVKDA